MHQWCNSTCISSCVCICRVLEKGEQLVDTAQLEPDGLGIQVCSHLSRQAEQQQQQQQIPSKSTSKPATRSRSTCISSVTESLIPGLEAPAYESRQKD